MLGTTESAAAAMETSWIATCNRMYVKPFPSQADESSLLHRLVHGHEHAQRLPNASCTSIDADLGKKKAGSKKKPVLEFQDLAAPLSSPMISKDCRIGG